MTTQDKKEFVAYLRQCTERQVLEVWEKEKIAGRSNYAKLAETEARIRNLSRQF